MRSRTNQPAGVQSERAAAFWGAALGSLGGWRVQPSAAVRREGADGYVGVDYSFRSWLFSGASDSVYTRLPELSLVNARVGVRHGHWDVYGWVRNLTDKNYFTIVQPGVGNTGSLYGLPGDPRTFGATLRVKF